MKIPPSQNTVTVRIIDSTSRIIVPNDFIDVPIKGDELIDCPAFSFLIEHPSGRRLLFDLGIRTDFQNLPPIIQSYFQDKAARVTVEKDVYTILAENGVDPKGIEGIIWSHWHWDHVGDPSTFPTSTSLIVGPGLTKTEPIVPGYPKNPGSPILESDFEGRKVIELEFGESAIKVGHFDAPDYFGDGSFYILDGPGHTVGHLCALARTTASPPSFILMGADACHHSGEMRPSKWLPLPETISPHPLQAGASIACPGSHFEHLLRGGDRKQPFYGQKRPGMFFCDPDIAEETIEKMQEADAEDNVLVVIAHDDHLKGVVDFFPLSANDFMARGWHKLVKWKFLSDFRGALLNSKYEGDVVIGTE